MPIQQTSRNKSLLLRGNTWHIHWNVPKGLRHDPLFRGKAIYTKSLKTKDVHEARKMRDMLVTQFRSMADVSAEQASRRAFLVAYAEAKQARDALAARLHRLDDIEQEQALDGLDALYCSESAHDRKEYEKSDGYLAATVHSPEIIERYAITLKDAAYEFIKEHQGKTSEAILSRVKLATASLLKAIGNKDVKLKDVTSRQVSRWIQSIGPTSSDSTRRNYIGALHKMWHWVWLNEHVDGISPFKGTKVERQGDASSYESFTMAEVQTLLTHADHATTEMMRYALITGCRIGELVTLTPASFINNEGVHAIQIFEGKTDAAARAIPLPLHLWSNLQQLVEAGTWSKRTVARWSNRFGELKLKATGKRDRSKAFHSFRHMTATAYERVHMEERIVSVILGHKNKRGQSMSYGLYSEGLAPKQYLEAVEKMIAGEYMQSFLKLFPQ